LEASNKVLNEMLLCAIVELSM